MTLFDSGVPELTPGPPIKLPREEWGEPVRSGDLLRFTLEGTGPLNMWYIGHRHPKRQLWLIVPVTGMVPPGTCDVRLSFGIHGTLVAHCGLSIWVPRIDLASYAVTRGACLHKLEAAKSRLKALGNGSIKGSLHSARDRCDDYRGNMENLAIMVSSLSQAFRGQMCSFPNVTTSIPSWTYIQHVAGRSPSARPTTLDYA